MTLAALATEAAGYWDGKVVALIRDRENAVFRMALPDGSFAALRLHRKGYQSDAAIRSELWFCTALTEKGLPVPKPLATNTGERLVQLSTGRAASAVEWLSGEPLGEAGVPLSGTVTEQTDKHHALGKLLARMHLASKAIVLPDDFIRPRWDIDGLTGEAPFWGRFWEHPALEPQEADRLLEARRFLRTAMQQHGVHEDLIPIHADVLRENILVNDHSLSIIDFDDAGIGFPLYDLGTTLSQNLYEPARNDLRAALIEGYQTLRPVDPQMVDAFTLARTLASIGWTMPRLEADDPIMRRHIARALLCADTLLP